MVIIVRGVFTKNNVRRILECLSIFEQYFSTSHLTFVFHPAAIPFPRAPVVRTATLPARKESGVHVKREYAPHPPDDAGEWMVRLAGKRLGGTPRPTMRPRGIGRRWKASPDGRTVCVRKEPTRIRFTRRAARRTEAINPPPPEKEAVFRSYATMRKTRATNRQNTPPPEGHAPFRLPAARNLPFMACHRWK